MKETERRQGTTLMMIIGALFIIVAGLIFATTAWRNLSREGKELIMGGVFLLGMGSAFLAEKKWHLPKAANVFFYIGAAAGGLTLLSVFREKDFSIALAAVGVLIPLVFRLIVQKKEMDVLPVIFLLDLAAVNVMEVIDFHGYEKVIVSAMLFCGFIVADGLQKHFCKKKWSRILFYIGYAINLVWFAILLLMCWICVLLHSSVRNDVDVILMSFLFLAASTVAWKQWNNKFCRWLQSVCMLLMGGNSLLIFFLEMNTIAYRMEWLDFSVFFLIGIFLIVSKREEFLISFTGMAYVNSFLQIFEEVHIVFPYLILYIMFLFGFVYQCNQDGKISQSNWKKIQIAILLQFVGVLAIGMKMMLPDSTDSSFYLLVSSALFSVGILRGIKNRTSLHIFYLLGALSGMAALLCQKVFYIPELVQMEWKIGCCAVFLIALRFLFWKYIEVVSKIQFVSSIALTAIWIIYDIHYGELLNVLILGIVGMIVLLAGIYSHSKSYTILAAVTLVVLVIYVTRAFWLAIAWWVYLFLAGCLLILLAIKKENAER